ncbi:M23 family metallopeptidase [Nocardia inohanensis]|uniref:M23 family metallopeptidase n=1 Tax=Nocardia inohanensis TaxID=209246 RepID=UPI000A895636
MPGGRIDTEEVSAAADAEPVDSDATPGNTELEPQDRDAGPESTDTADEHDGLRRKTATYTPGVRSHLMAPAASSSAWARKQLDRVGEVSAKAVAAAREQAPIVRDRAAGWWEQRPRSRAEAAALAKQGRDEFKRQAPVAKAWAIKHRVLIAGMTAVVVFASADSALGMIPLDAEASPGVAVRVPVAHPLQVNTTAGTAKRYLDAINNGEKLREAAVVAAAARQTLERAKAEAAAAVAGEYQPWISATTPYPEGTLPPGYAPGGFALPAKGAFTSGFGSRWGTFHAGIDIAGPLGSPIYAVAAGTVIDAGPAQGFGLWVRIRHDDGTISVYGHMYDFFVSVGERVPAGMQIARIGNRGDSTGPHLHFEIIVGGQHVDPAAWLAARGLSLT